jgi:RND superfamily putative drug exporter
LLARLAHFSYRRRWLVLGAWVTLLVGTQVLAHVAGGTSSMDFKLPASDSQRAQQLLTSKFSSQAGAGGDIVVASASGVASPTIRPRVERMLAAVAALPGVADVRSPYTAQARGQISRDRTVAFAPVQFSADRQHLKKATSDSVAAVAQAAVTPDLRVELSGSMFGQRRPPGGTEGVGVLGAVVILLVAFGSVLAMGLPIMTALFGVGIGLAAATLLANVFSIPDFTSQLAAMIGIGVGIDYALFIVSRFRNSLHDGLDPERAVTKSVTTSGKAVLFAGCTVVISLLGMFAMGLSFVRGLAIGASIAVLATMAAAVTLLPAVLGFVGANIDKLAFAWVKRSDEHAQRGPWFRWSRIIQRRPWPFAVVGLGVLVVLALPVFSLRLGNTDAGNLPTTDTTRRAYDLLATGFGPGFNGPLLVAAELPTRRAASALPRLEAALASTAGVASVSPARVGPSGGAAIIEVFPTTGPQEKATVDLTHRLRDRVIPRAVAATGLVVHIGGVTATFDDLSSFLGAHLPVFILAVLGLSFLLLLAVFRSVVVPVKAVVMNLLSIGAAYGLLVAVFQWGYGKGLIGVGKKGPIEAFVPMMMFAIVFGLSMDYEVFLLSRIKEEWDRTGDNGIAVADGLSYTGRVITAAAAIMVCVFGSFVFGDNRVVKEFGLGLAAAVFIDATLVRMILVPATMELIGAANWWVPSWLDRLLPGIHIEGERDDIDVELETLGDNGLKTAGSRRG